MCPRWGKDPASGHPRAHQPPLGRGTSPPAWDGRLDAHRQRRGPLPSSVWTRRKEVKQGKSGGSVGATDQGNGKERSGERPMGTTAYGGKGSKGRAANGDRPIGAAGCRRVQYTMPPPPPPLGHQQQAENKMCSRPWLWQRIWEVLFLTPMCTVSPSHSLLKLRAFEWLQPSSSWEGAVFTKVRPPRTP